MVLRAGHRAGAIGREADCVDLGAMAGERVAEPVGADIPEDGGFIGTPRDQMPAIRREGKAVDDSLMALEQGLQPAAGEIIEADGTALL